jgi:hypothetical protein
MSVAWEMVGAVFFAFLCLAIARGIYVRRVQEVRRRLIYGPRKAKHHRGRHLPV